MVGLLSCEHTSPGHVELLVNQHPQVLLLRAALNPLSWILMAYLSRKAPQGYIKHLVFLRNDKHIMKCVSYIYAAQCYGLFLCP